MKEILLIHEIMNGLAAIGSIYIVRSQRDDSNSLNGFLVAAEMIISFRNTYYLGLFIRCFEIEKERENNCSIC